MYHISSIDSGLYSFLVDNFIVLLGEMEESSAKQSLESTTTSLVYVAACRAEYRTVLLPPKGSCCAGANLAMPLLFKVVRRTLQITRSNSSQQQLS